MPLAAASALVACGIDLQSYGEPFFDLARDAGVNDAAVNEQSDSAGRSAEGPRTGRAAPAQNAADGGSRARGAADLDDSEDAGVGEDAGGAGGHAARDD